MVSINDFNPDTQVTIPLAAEMLGIDPRILLQRLVDLSLNITFEFRISNDRASFLLRGCLDDEKRAMVMTLIQFGSATYYGVNCMFGKPLSLSGGRACWERKCHSPDWCHKPFNANQKRATSANEN